MFEKVGGLPAHPLFVHLPLVLGPVLGLVMLAMLVPAWRDRLAWPAAALGVVFALSAFFSAESGEWLARALRVGEAVEEHEEAAELLTKLGWVAAILLVGFAALRKRMTGMVPIVASVLLAAVGLVTILQTVRTGHEGAELVWEDTPLPGANDPEE